jgi:Uncharacterized protein conserved in bacteria (DUF2252)
MSFRTDNAAFEKWLRRRCKVVEADLKYKHKRMRKNAFVFLRATYFRWAKGIETICPELKNAPRVLCVGDTHTENFGTWRDAQGRLVWGVNDFDEAAIIPYAFDLVRLAASVSLAPKMRIGRKQAAAAILAGYRLGLRAPRPTLLDEHQTRLRPFVVITDAEREKFWREVACYPKARPPARVRRNLKKSLPLDAPHIRFASRVKGGGSLGRARYVAIAEWRGGHIVREAKAIVPSAWNWAHSAGDARPRFLELATGRFRSPDPFLAVKRGFVIRRIAADSRKIDLGDNAGAKLKINLLKAMGFDLGAIHAATKGARRSIMRDLRSRDSGWLSAAAKAAETAARGDFAEWKRGRRDP